MTDALLSWFRRSLPAELVDLVTPTLQRLESGDYESLLKQDQALLLFGHIENDKTRGIRLEDFTTWSDFIFHRLGILLADRSKPEGQFTYFSIGYAALLAFLQSNVTGLPLAFAPPATLFLPEVAESRQQTQIVRNALLASLGMDGIAAYKLTPHVELLCLADVIMTCPAVLKNVKPARWAKMRVTFLQQRLLSEVSSTLQGVIYDDLTMIGDDILGGDARTGLDSTNKVEFLLERASIHVHHTLDKLARADLDEAKRLRQFDFALTGRLGKRTKFQENDLSQLVVLAKSAEADEALSGESANGNCGMSSGSVVQQGLEGTNPIKLDLNDDTLLESISFSKELSTKSEDESTLPISLASLDPSKQPQLSPLDSIVLLLFASSISNTSPQHGLTREETLPYATRVLDGGSSNWQVYTQALLVRSRIEGFKSRTVERGLLQLQALVDQVIADTNSGDGNTSDSKASLVTASFLPKAKESESAPVTERLRFIFQLASPTRWDLEAELATRWVELGGLRSALEIYERLEMWAEAALCWAATEREDKAKRMMLERVKMNYGKVLSVVPPPLDAPRLYCILGDIDQSPVMYEKAWEVSGQRYARAQRSLGRLYFSARDYVKATEAYSKSLKINQLNQSSWFALGCALLELARFDKAVEAFSRCVQLDDSDAESWSNLAAALLRAESTGVDVNISLEDKGTVTGAGNGVVPQPMRSPMQRREDALKALKRAANLKHDSYRIWENVLIVAASLSPPEYASILTAQKRIIDLRGRTDGEKCIDEEILGVLTQHVVTSSPTYDPSKPGLPRMFVKLIDESVTPLITGSANLWQLIGKVALWRGKPLASLEAEEKAWRAVTSQSGWETENEQRWNEVVEATVRLSDSYESLGPRERTDGMGAGHSVAQDWKFKAKSAVRTVLGRGKGSWEGTDGWQRLQDVTKGLRG